MGNCCNQDVYPDMEMRKWEVACSTPLVPASNFYTKNEIDEMLEDIEISGGCNCDLDDYATKDEVTAGLATKLDASAYTPTDLSDYYTKEQVDASLSGKADVSDIPSLSGYATEQWVENKGYLTQHQPIKTINNISLVGEGNIEIGTGGTIDLSDYYTKSETNNVVSNATSGKADTSAVTAVSDALTAHTTNTAMHVTSNEKYNWNNKLDATAYTPVDLSGYATEQWVENQGYLTEHQSLANYYNKGEVNSLLDNKLDTTAYTPTDLSNYWTTAQTQSAITQSVSGYATEQWVQSQGYLTEHQSLSGYATQQWVQSQGYLTEHQSLSGYATTATTNTINNALTSHTSNSTVHVTSTEKSNWNNKADVWCGTEAQYNAIATKQPNTIYLIREDD